MPFENYFTVFKEPPQVIMGFGHKSSGVSAQSNCA